MECPFKKITRIIKCNPDSEIRTEVFNKCTFESCMAWDKREEKCNMFNTIKQR